MDKKEIYAPACWVYVFILSSLSFEVGVTMTLNLSLLFFSPRKQLQSGGWSESREGDGRGAEANKVRALKPSNRPGERGLNVLSYSRRSFLFYYNYPVNADNISAALKKVCGG